MMKTKDLVWKEGYEEGFAAGWKAAKQDNTLNYQNFPPVYYGSYNPVVGVASPVGSYSQTMADSLGIVSGSQYTVNTTTDYGAVTLNETKTIRNLTDHTRIV